MQSASDTDFVFSVCLPLLQTAQNSDGGWGFHSGSPSRVEATCWALLSLIHLEPSNEQHETGFRFLRGTQLPDGSWPSSAEQSVGCWATSLACWVLESDPASREAVAAGLNWICKDLPRGPSLFQRVISSINRRNKVVAQDESLQGWGWTPDTASWVEPTAFALIALDQAPKELLPNGAGKRCQSAKALLYNRMCREGGWNCGNPMVYGVPGDPLVEPTVWALLALRNESQRPEVAKSLAWLEKSIPTTLGAGSLALAKICFETFAKEWPPNAPDLKDLYAKNEFLASIPVLAWTCLALGAKTIWPGTKAVVCTDAKN